MPMKIGILAAVLASITLSGCAQQTAVRAKTAPSAPAPTSSVDSTAKFVTTELRNDYLNGLWGCSTTENSVEPNAARPDVYTFKFAKFEHSGVYSGTIHKSGWVTGSAKARLYLNSHGHHFKIVWMADGDPMTQYVDVINENKAVLYTDYDAGSMGEVYIYRKPSSQIQKSQPRFEASLLKVHLDSYRTASGGPAKMVRVDWKNTGNRPIEAVFAEIHAYDSYGNLLESSADDYCIYAAESDSQVIQPGKIGKLPRGDGFILPSYQGEAVRVKVRILRAE